MLELQMNSENVLLKSLLATLDLLFGFLYVSQQYYKHIHQ